MVFQPRALRYMYVIKIINGKCFRLRNVGVMTMKNLHFLDLVVSKISTNCHIGLVVCCILFYVLFGNYAVILRRIDYRWKAANWASARRLWLWSGRDHHRATLAVTQDLRFSGVIWRTSPLICLTRQASGYDDLLKTHNKEISKWGNF